MTKGEAIVPDLAALRELAHRLTHATECEDKKLTLFEAERLARALLAALDVVTDLERETASHVEGHDCYVCNALARFKEATDV